MWSFSVQSLAEALRDAQSMQAAMSAALETSKHPDRRPAVKPTLIVAPADCYKHRTCPEPITRAGPDMPPENVHRLKVLTDPGE